MQELQLVHEGVGGVTEMAIVYLPGAGAVVVSATVKQGQVFLSRVVFSIEVAEVPQDVPGDGGVQRGRPGGSSRRERVGRSTTAAST